MDDVFTLLDKLEGELLGARNAVFSKKSVVDATKCLQILTEIKNGLPSSLKKAQDILDNSVEIVRQSNQKAKEIVGIEHPSITAIPDGVSVVVEE